MVTVQKPSAGSRSSIASIASGNNSESILNANLHFETTPDGSGVPLKVRKPYTISKQREKWTEDEHQKFIEALKLYGRSWRQIEEHISTKTAVQIRSHAQKFFTKVMKEGSGSTEGSNESIEIPPPRPKRKPLHPYPRKSVEAPNKTRLCSSVLENRTSANMKPLERGSDSPTSVLTPEGSQIATSHAKDLGSGNASATSLSSNIYHVLENSLIEDNLNVGKEKDKEENLILTVNFCGPSLDDLTPMKAAKEFKGIELRKEEDAYSETRAKFALLKTIKLFGHNVVVSSPLPVGTKEPVASKCSQANASTPEYVWSIDSQIDIIGGGYREMKGSKGISCTGSNNSFRGAGHAETSQDSVDSKIEFNHPLGLCLSLNSCKSFVSDREAVFRDGMESHRIGVYL
ncbi:hypothetical protein QQ045_027107 [Rhodiola kirilowii]